MKAPFLTLTLALTASAADPQTAQVSPPKSLVAEPVHTGLARGALLTPDQQAKTNALYQQEQAALGAIYYEKGLSRQERLRKMQKVSADFREKRDSLLTPEQTAQIKAWAEQRRAKAIKDDEARQKARAQTPPETPKAP